MPHLRRSQLPLFGLYRGLLLCIVAVALTGSDHPVRAQFDVGSDRTMHNIVEKELSRWKPTRENDAVPSPKLRCAVQDLTGVWRRHTGLGTTIKLFPVGQGKYKVLFATGGCLSRWRLERLATYRDGTLLLDRPVQEYIPFTYNRIFTIRTPAGIRLVPDAVLGFRRKHNQEISPEFDLFVHGQ